MKMFPLTAMGCSITVGNNKVRQVLQGAEQAGKGGKEGQYTRQRQVYGKEARGPEGSQRNINTGLLIIIYQNNIAPVWFVDELGQTFN
jgi:hypothetical protein